MHTSSANTVFNYPLSLTADCFIVPMPAAALKFNLFLSLVFAICFVEVSAPKNKQKVGISCLLAFFEVYS
jgi:hypothetical protein